MLSGALKKNSTLTELYKKSGGKCRNYKLEPKMTYFNHQQTMD